MAKVPVDAIDHKILHYLTENARMPLLEIARECGISGAAIHQRVKKLGEAGVITGMRLEVSPKNIGMDVCAIIGIRISDSSKNYETVERLKQLREITECHFVTGAWNIIIKVYCLDNEHLMRTIFDGVQRIPWVSHTETFISLSEAFSRPMDVDLIKEEQTI